MSASTDKLHYALAKIAPDMERGFTIQTAYGEFRIEDGEAKLFIRLLEKVIERRLKAAVKQAAA